MGRGLELGKEYQFLEPAIDARGSLARNDFEVIDHADRIEFGLNRYRIVEVRAHPAKTPQCQIRRARGLITTDQSIFGSDYLAGCRQATKKNSESEQSQYDADNSRHREWLENVVEACLPAIATVLQPRVRKTNSSLELKIFRYLYLFGSGNHIAK